MVVVVVVMMMITMMMPNRHCRWWWRWRILSHLEAESWVPLWGEPATDLSSKFPWLNFLTRSLIIIPIHKSFPKMPTSLKSETCSCSRARCRSVDCLMFWTGTFWSVFDNNNWNGQKTVKDDGEIAHQLILGVRNYSMCMQSHTDPYKRGEEQ